MKTNLIHSGEGGTQHFPMPILLFFGNSWEGGWQISTKADEKVV